MTEKKDSRNLELLARFAGDKAIPRFSRFLDPAEMRQASEMAENHHTGLLAWGGYEEAERKQVCFFPADSLPPEKEEFPLTCLASPYHAKFNKITHRDILGAFMSLGLTRSCLGDIIIDDTSVFLFVTDETAAFVMDSLTEANRAKLSFHIVEDMVILPKPKGSYFRAVVSSLRLDSVLSAACHISRTKSAELIRSGSVKLNHIECLRADETVEVGSVLSVRNFGRVKVVSFDGETKKERLGLTFFQYE